MEGMKASLLLANKLGSNALDKDLPFESVRLSEREAESRLIHSTCRFVAEAVRGLCNVQLQVNLANVSTGLYLGSLLVSSANGGVQSLPVSVKVAAKTLYLPLITR